MTAERKRILFIVIVPLVLLLIPFIGMQLSTEVNWTTADFIMAAILLFGTGIVLEIVIRKVKKNKTKIIVIAAILAALLLLWAEMAVGIFGTPLAGS